MRKEGTTMFNWSVEKLTKGALWATIGGIIVTTASDIWAKIRRDKREQNVYARLEIAADTVATNTFKTDKEEA